MYQDAMPRTASSSTGGRKGKSPSSKTRLVGAASLGGLPTETVMVDDGLPTESTTHPPEVLTME